MTTVCPCQLLNLQFRRFFTTALCVLLFCCATPILPAATLTVLYSFTNGIDAGRPQAALVQGSDGNFYGTTHFGSVFKITSSGVLTTLYLFTNQIDGSYPWGLVQGNDGNFYGTTGSGGTAYFGNIFKITSSGTLTPLCSFNGVDGAYPGAALVQGSDGNFYGTTSSGGGTGLHDGSGFGNVFKITSSGVLTPLYSFTGGIDGADPEAALV
jgi:uncharacterized repeat protein (TIGR03803 family)